MDRSDIETLKPFLAANSNNLSKTLRQIIREYRLQTSMSKTTADQHKLMELRNQIIEDRIAELVPVPLVKWLAKSSQGVPPLGTFRVIAEKYAKLIRIDNISLNDHIDMIKIFGYPIRQNVEMGADPRSMRISFEAEDADQLKYSVMNFSCMLAHHPLTLKIGKVIESPNLVKVEYEQCSSEEEAYKSVTEHFGRDQLILDEIKNNIQFWRNAVNILKADHYEDVIMSREVFLKILKSHEFSDHLNNLVSSIYGVAIKDIGSQSIIRFIGEILKANGLIYRIEHDENEIQVYHKFDERNINRIINRTIIKTLRKSDQHFVIGKEDKMTILSRREKI